MSDELDDYRWLVSDSAARWLAETAADARPLTTVAAGLRKQLTAGRARLVLEQVDLRRRGRAKFTSADRMFFTRVGLEQATDQWVAAHKAAGFAAGAPAADLCCGVGGDLLALAGRGPAVGVDRDPVVALFAEANLRSAPAEPLSRVVARDAGDFPFVEVAAWHADPDRRPVGRRTTRVEDHEPDLTALDAWRQICPDAAIKLAPACDPPPPWAAEAELQWIGRDRECRQLVAWFGRLARHSGRRTAIVLHSPGGGADATARVVVGPVANRPEEAGIDPGVSAVARFVYEPDPAVLAARLTDALAAEHGLARIDRRSAYLTGDRAIADPALAAFEVTDVLPYDLKRVKTLLRERSIGLLEIKKRGVADDPETLRRRLDLRGDRTAVLLLTPTPRGTTAILGRRVH